MQKLLLSIGVYVVLTAPLQAQEAEARAILEKALKAHGLDKPPAALAASTATGKGTIHVMGMALDFNLEAWSQMPDKSKSVVDLSINGMNILVTQVINGDKGWQNVAGMLMNLDKETMQEAKEMFHIDKVIGLYSIKADKNLKISPLGETKVGDKTLIGLQVTKKDKRDVNLYFDKKTNLLFKAEYRALDPFTKMDVTQEKLYSDYKEFVPGIKSATKITINNDGQRYMDLEITDATAMERLDESIFAKPD